MEILKNVLIVLPQISFNKCRYRLELPPQGNSKEKSSLQIASSLLFNPWGILDNMQWSSQEKKITSKSGDLQFYILAYSFERKIFGNKHSHYNECPVYSS